MPNTPAPSPENAKFGLLDAFKALIGLAFFGAIGLAAWDSYQVPSPGSRCTLRVGTHGVSTLTVFDEYEQVLDTSDGFGLLELYQSQKLYDLPAGVKVRVMEITTSAELTSDITAG